MKRNVIAIVLLGMSILAFLIWQLGKGGRDSTVSPPTEPSYESFVIKFQITTSWSKLGWDFVKSELTVGTSQLFDDDPDVYLLLRIDGVQDPVVIPVVHDNCQDRPVNQTVVYKSDLNGKRVVVEVWDSDDDGLMANVRALLSGVSLNAGIKNGVSINASIDGKEIAQLLRNEDDYLCQAEVILGKTVGPLEVNSQGGNLISDLHLEVLPK